MDPATSADYKHSEDEQRVNDLILQVFGGIQKLNGRRLAFNHDELAQATHTLQNFVRQAACSRLDLFGASDWWKDD